MKGIALFLLVILSITTYSWNAKEDIPTKNNKADSISYLIKQLNDSIMRDNTEKSTQIVGRVKNLKTENKMLTGSLGVKKKELSALKLELNTVKSDFFKQKKEFEKKQNSVPAPKVIYIERRKNFFGREKIDTIKGIDTIIN